MSQFEPGKMVNLSRLVHRVVAPNAGMMTGPGTNTYLIGNKTLAVIDPGPASPEHVDAICNAAKSLQGEIKWIICTHTHSDHSPGAQLLKAKTSAPLVGIKAPPNGMGQDPTFEPDLAWQHHSQLATEEFNLTAIHTPGHASNHLCFLLEQEGLLFSGDHIMNGSTVVIAPPDGNMQHYLRSLEQLKHYEIKHIMPGHGDVMDKPQEIIEGTIQHRLMREQKTLERLAMLQPCTLETLTESVYDEVPPFLHSLAKFSLLAHLEKLVAENVVHENNDQWQLLQ